MTKTERIENIVKKLKTRKSKNIIYFIVIILIAFCFAYRFYMINQENKIDVFNIARNNLNNGVPVQVLTVEKTDGILYEPLTVKNNRAYVSGSRVNIFKPGQKIGNCKIVSVSSNLDLDTGMFVITTSKCSDGLQYVENKRNGFYVPVSAVSGNNVFIAEDNIARVQEVVIGGRDATNVLITYGLKNGDSVILSDVKDNQKIKILNK